MVDRGWFWFVWGKMDDLCINPPQPDINTCAPGVDEEGEHLHQQVVARVDPQLGVGRHLLHTAAAAPAACAGAAPARGRGAVEGEDGLEVGFGLGVGLALEHDLALLLLFFVSNVCWISVRVVWPTRPVIRILHPEPPTHTPLHQPFPTWSFEASTVSRYDTTSASANPAEQQGHRHCCCSFSLPSSPTLNPPTPSSNIHIPAACSSGERSIPFSPHLAQQTPPKNASMGGGAAQRGQRQRKCLVSRRVRCRSRWGRRRLR